MLLFYFEFDGNQVPSTLDLGDCIWRGDLLEVFLHYDFGGLTFGGAYRWRGLFLEFCAVVMEDFKQSKFNG